MYFERAAIGVLLISLLMSSASADSYRCGRKLVRTGDPVSKLVETCGRPLHKSTGTTALRLEGRVREVRVQEWHYRMGPRRLGRVVMVYRGRIAAIEVARR